MLQSSEPSAAPPTKTCDGSCSGARINVLNQAVNSLNQSTFQLTVIQKNEFISWSTQHFVTW